MDGNKKGLIVFLVAAFLSVSLVNAEEPKLGFPLSVKWVTKLKKEKTITRRPYQFATPLFVNSNVYVGAASGWFYALDSKNGKKLWKKKLSAGIYAEAAAEGDNLYIADRKGTIYSVTRGDGSIIWQSEVGDEVSSKPLVVGDTIFVATADKQLVALDKASGSKKWQTAREGILPPMTIKGASDPVLYNDRIYVGYADGNLVAYRAEDGAVVWKIMLAKRGARFRDVDSTPLIMDNTIYISSVAGGLFAVNPKDGKIIWQMERGGPNDMAADGGMLYLSGGGKLSCINLSTKEVLWEHDFNEAEVSAPAVKGGLIAVMSTEDKIYIVDASTGELKFNRHLGRGSFGNPVISDDMLYIFSNSSNFFALR